MARSDGMLGGSGPHLRSYRGLVRSYGSNLRSYGTLLYGFLSRNFTLVLRYPLNFLGSLITYLLVFLIVFWGGQRIAPQEFGESLAAIIVGYFLLSTTLRTFFSLSGMIHSEARYGTLQQLYISPFRFTTILASAIVASLVISTSIGVINLLIVLQITGESLTLDLFTIAPILVLTLFHAIGLSFFLGGFALIYKRIRSLFPIIQFFFIGFISIALTGRLWARLLPVGQGAWMMRAAMDHGVRYWQFQPADHAMLVGTGLLYLGFGYGAFHVAQQFARQRGLLDDY